MLWKFDGLLKLLYSNILICICIIAYYYYLHYIFQYFCLWSEFIGVYEVKKLSFGLFSIWPLTELAGECLLVKAFFQFIERCCDLPWQHLIRNSKNKINSCADFHSCAVSVWHLLTPAILPPHSGLLKVPSSLNESLILWLLKTSIHNSAAWTELLVMRAFVKHVLSGYANALRFLSIDLSWIKYLTIFILVT